jgi:hypothetical protein
LALNDFTANRTQAQDCDGSDRCAWNATATTAGYCGEFSCGNYTTAVACASHSRRGWPWAVESFIS